MKQAYKIVRLLLVIVLAVAFLVPASLYVLLSLPSVQQGICRYAEKELEKKLTVGVDVRQVALSPFNKVALLGVTVYDAKADTALKVERLAAGVSIKHLMRRELVFNFAELTGMDLRLRRDSLNSPLNIDPIIKALSAKDTTKAPTQYDLRINTVVIRRGKVSYDVLSMPRPVADRFDANHMRVTGLRADLRLPRVSNDDITIDLRRLAFEERCGLNVKNLAGEFVIKPNEVDVSNLLLDVGQSRLRINDQTVDIAKLKADKDYWKKMPLNVALLPGTRVATSDLSRLLPALSGIDMNLDLTAHVRGNIGALCIDSLRLSDANRINLMVNGEVKGLPGKDIELDIPNVSLTARGGDIVDIASRFARLSETATQLISAAGDVTLTADYNGTLQGGNIKAELATDLGRLLADAFVNKNGATTTLRGHAEALEVKGVPGVKALADLTNLNATTDFDLTLSGGNPQGHVEAEVGSVTWRGVAYNDITAHADINGLQYSGAVNIENPGVALDLNAELDLDPKLYALDFNINASHIDLAALNIIKPDSRLRRLSLSGEGSMRGRDIDHANGFVYLRDVLFADSHGEGPHIDNLSLVATSSDTYQNIRFASDIADATINGKYSLSKLPALCKAIVSRVFPALIESDKNMASAFDATAPETDMRFNVQLKNTEPLSWFVKLPVKELTPIDISGQLSSATRSMNLALEAPYLQQGKNVIENTSLRMGIDGGMGNDDARANLYATSLIPTKNGPMTVSISSFGSDGQIDTQAGWHISREHQYNGDISVSTRFSRNNKEQLVTLLGVNPGKVVINDTVWRIEPSKVEICDGKIDVHNFRGGRDDQYVIINGTASKDPADVLKLTLHDMSLDYVFETLNIDAARFGGQATGEFYASELFSEHPRAYTPSLSVKRMTYNRCLLGDADIRSSWLAERKAVELKATVNQPDGRKSYVDGRILPMSDSLDLHFNCDRLPVGFLQHFMQAFATEVGGYASGRAHLYGTFKLVDMVGDVYGEDIKIKLGFTNTSYTTTDSVHLRPGRIELNNLTIRDIYGHTAKLNGELRHKFFKEPSFNFAITQASNLLVYDVKESPDARWYGTVFGNGGASVQGRPGYINIGVDVSTAPNSKFTFVLSDAQEASDYNFITFRDRDQASKDLAKIDLKTPGVVQEFKRNAAQAAKADAASVYDLNIAVDVNPNALVTLVMDPVGGDKITAYGNGNMRLNYNSGSDDLRMFGNYTLTRGNYNFTLQDIIIKDFTILDGSSIAFHGNPYAAQLDIKAAYQLNANLSDLDESFLQDKDLNRTNVPVRAMLLVTGDLRAPDINFDLEFPTLTSDIYRKVRSIVNTDEMMNRQIIYLLALNRFYTPEYMSATKGNELVSVASSTISSQLGNMLGQLSDKWSISPNFRSDRGDFSDLEVDLALSSHLLNNRLLLNGNFGYRDKTLNNNAFIGDFDIEYLLNRAGTIRLKAYNRYNDQNYYVKSALTTQGVGVVFKRDFDNMSSFIRRLMRKRTSKTDSITPDSIKQ